MSEDERIQRFKELIKQGYGVNKALAEVGLSKKWYTKHYDEIWSDPEMAQYRPKPRVRSENVEKVAQRLKEYGLGDEELTPVEKEAMELEEKRKKLLKAAQKIVMMYSTPGAPGPRPRGEKPEEERPEDPFATFEKTLKSFEEGRAKLKEMLEKMGFKVEDMYMRRDEVERLLQEERQKAQEEMLDDKRIRAVENIVNQAVAKLTEMFKPAIDAIFATPPTPPLEAQPPTTPEQPKRRQVLVPAPSILPEEEKKSEEKPSVEGASSQKESSEPQKSSA